MNAPVEETATGGGPPRSGRRRWRRLVFGIVLVIVALPASAVLLLQFEGVFTRVVNGIAVRFNPWPGTHLSVARASLRGLGFLRATELLLAGPDGVMMARVDTAVIGIRPLALLRRRLVLPEVYLAGAELLARQQPDSTWDLLSPFTGEDDAGSAAPFVVSVGDLRITRARAEVRFHAPADSVLRIERLEADLGDLRVGDAVTLRIDTLGARLHPPMTPGRPAELSARGEFRDGVLTADHLLFLSDSSQVSARGTLILPGAETADDREVDFRLRADPLDFRDVSAVIPGFSVPGSLHVNAHFRGSATLVEFEADGRSFDGGTLTAVGAFTPQARHAARYALEASIHGVRPDRWTAGELSMGPMDATLNMDLSGPDLQTLSGTATLRLDAFRFRDLTVAPTSVDATIQQGALRYIAAGGVGGLAAIRAHGEAHPFADTVTATMIAEARQLADTVLGPVHLSRARMLVEIRWDQTQGQMTLQGSAQADQGTAAFAAELRPSDPVPTWAITRVAVDQLNLSHFNQDWPASDLAARFTARGQGYTAESLRGAGTLALRPSIVGTERLDTLHLAWVLEDQTLEVRGSGHSARATAVIAASLHPFQETPTFHLDSLRMAATLADTAEAAATPCQVAGVLRASGALPADAVPEVEGTLDLDPMRWNRGELVAGRLDFGLVQGRLTTTGQAHTRAGALSFEGNAHLERSDTSGIRLVSGHLEGVARVPDLGEFLSEPSRPAEVVAQFRLEAGGADPRRDQWSAVLRAEGSYAGVQIDTLRLEARTAGGMLTLDTLTLRSNVATGAGAGTLALSDRASPSAHDSLWIRIEADSGMVLSEALALQVFSLRGGALGLSATTVDGEVEARARLLVQGLVSSGPWADSMQIDGRARLRNLRPDVLTAEFGGRHLGYGNFELEALTGSVEYDTTRTHFDALFTGDDRHTMRLDGTLIPRERSLTVTAMTVDLDGREWTLTAPALIVTEPRIVVDGFTLMDGERRIAVDGTLDRAGMQDLSVVLDAVPIRGFAEFAGFKDLEGMLDGRLHLTGPAERVILESVFEVELMETSGTVALATAADNRLQVDGHLTDGRGRALVLGGTVPLAISLAADAEQVITRDGPIALTVQADSFGISWLAPFAARAGVERLEGNVQANLQVGGTFADPEMSGTATLLRGRMAYPRQGMIYENIAGEFSFDGPRIRVASLRATSGGTAVVEGEILMADAASPRLDLRGRFSRFRAARNEWTRLGFSGEVTVTGDLLAPRVVGEVQLLDTDIYADPVGEGGPSEAIILTEEDYRMLATYFGYRPGEEVERDPLDAMALDLDVSLGPGTWLRKRTQPEMRVQLGGSLDVRKESGEEMQVFGTIEVLPARSYFEQFGRRFQVEAGTVTFNGPMLEWTADFQARYMVPSPQDPRMPEVVITLAVRGGLDDLDLTLGSDPAMETADILSYLATGRPAASAASFGGGGEDGVGGLGASFAAGQIAQALEQTAAEHVGLDVIEIRHDGIRGATVVAGRYVTPRLFVGFEQPLTLRSEDTQTGRSADQSGEIQLEYAAYRWLLLNLQRGQSHVEFFLRVRRAF